MNLRTLSYIAILLVAVACATKAHEEPAMREWTFEAAYTKAAVSGEGAFSWSKGDGIAVWNSESSSFVTFTSVTGKGKFRAVAPANAHFTEAAFYPSGIAKSTGAVEQPSSYASPEASAAGFPMYAQVEENTELLSFRHLGALVELTLTTVPEGAIALVLSSPTVSLSGNFGISGSPAEIQAAPGSGAVRVTFPATAGGESITVTVPVPVGSYPLSIALDSSSNTLFSLVGSENINFQRAHLYKPAPIVSGEIPAVPFDSDIVSFNLEGDDENWQ